MSSMRQGKGRRVDRNVSESGPKPGNPAMSVEQILKAIGSLTPADRMRLVSQRAPEICRATMDDPQAITMMLAECRRACQEPEGQRRMEFAMGIMRRMRRGA